MYCPPGEENNGTGDNCTKCAIGTYKEQAGVNDCAECPTGNITESTGATSVSQCDVGKIYKIKSTNLKL